MLDKIALEIAGRRIERFISYSVDADLYAAGAAFSLELSGGLDFEIAEGARCRLLVNDQLSLTGIADRITESNNKRGSRVTVDGRDLMGLVVDSYVTDFVTLTGVTLKDLTQRLLGSIPEINRSAVRYQAGLANAEAKSVSSSVEWDFEQVLAQVEPGRTVFEVLRDCAQARGAMFFGLPDGTFVFDRPVAQGTPAYRLTRRRDGRGNNVIDGSRVRDSSQRYRKIVVVGQRQGTDSSEPEELNLRGEAIDEQAPIDKTMVVYHNTDGKSPGQEAALLKEKQTAAALRLIYIVKGHAQGNRNWTINELATVEDEVLRVAGTFLVVGRTFRLDRAEGPVTEVRLGLPGVIG